jgi:hypothetical protein
MKHYQSNVDDEFSNLPISRQRKWQLRNIQAGLCQICSAKAVTLGGLCLEHLIKNREKQRVKQGSKRRYRSKSYELEKTIK